MPHAFFRIIIAQQNALDKHFFNFSPLLGPDCLRGVLEYGLSLFRLCAGHEKPLHGKPAIGFPAEHSEPRPRPRRWAVKVDQDGVLPDQLDVTPVDDDVILSAQKPKPPVPPKDHQADNPGGWRCPPPHRKRSQGASRPAYSPHLCTANRSLGNTRAPPPPVLYEKMTPVMLIW